MSDEEKVVAGQEIIISSAGKMNRVRDIGLFLVVALLFFNIVLFWISASNQEASDRELSEYYKAELRHIREREVENIKKVAELTAEQHEETRRLITEAVKRLEKK